MEGVRGQRSQLQSADAGSAAGFMTQKNPLSSLVSEWSSGLSSSSGLSLSSGEPHPSFMFILRCNEGSNQSASWKPSDSAHSNRRRLLLKQIQKDLERPPAQELPCSSPQPLPLLEKHWSNGRSGPALTLAHCRGPGPGDRGPGLGRVTLVQELSELEAQIQVIKEQLQTALRRKQELEQLQSEHQQAGPAGPGQVQSTQ